MFFEATYVWNNGSPLDNAAPYIAVPRAAFSTAYSLRFIVKVFFTCWRLQPAPPPA